MKPKLFSFVFDAQQNKTIFAKNLSAFYEPFDLKYGMESIQNNDHFMVILNIRKL